MLPVIVIPAYQPSFILVELVKKMLAQSPEQQFIIVDDGSSMDRGEVFAALSVLPGVHLLKHATNLGKGQALKTAFNYYLLNYATNHVGVVTADADGQHTEEDIQHLSNNLIAMPHCLWLGVRKFDRKVPLRSRFGNILTRRIFKFVVGSEIQDTQTGLRAIPHSFLMDIMRIPATGYEFELDVLITATTHALPIRETAIHTVYIDNNKSSHFNPILDSLKIYWVFLRFAALSIASAGVDFILFTIAFLFSHNLLLSTAAARVMSGSFNFFFCKTVIFRSKGKYLTEAIKYILLAFLVMMVSYVAVATMVDYFGINVYVSKIIADLGIFLSNFAVQNLLVFRSRNRVVEVVGR